MVPDRRREDGGYPGADRVRALLRPRPREDPRGTSVVPVPAAASFPAADPAAARLRRRRRSGTRGRGCGARGGWRQPRGPLRRRLLRRRRQHPQLAQPDPARWNRLTPTPRGGGTADRRRVPLLPKHAVEVLPPDPVELRLVTPARDAAGSCRVHHRRPRDLPLPPGGRRRDAGQARHDRPVGPLRRPARRRRLRLRASRLRARRQVPRAR